MLPGQGLAGRPYRLHRRAPGELLRDHRLHAGVEHRNAANLVAHAVEELLEPADLARVPFIDNVAFNLGNNQPGSNPLPNPAPTISNATCISGTVVCAPFVGIMSSWPITDRKSTRLNSSHRT